MRFVLNMLGFTGGGGLTVGRGLIPHLASEGRRHRFIVLVPDGGGYEGLEVGSNVEMREIVVSRQKHIRRVLIDQVLIPGICETQRADALLNMSNFGPFRVGVPQGVGVHLGYLAYPDSPVWVRLPSTTRAFLSAQVKYFRANVRRMQRVVSLTESMAKRLARYCGVDSRIIATIPNALEPGAYLSRESTPRLLRMFEARPAAFRLCYTALAYPHKNHSVLPQVASILARRYGPQELQFVVTVTSGDSRAAPQFLRDCEKHRVSDYFVNVGRASLDEIATIYRMSQVLLMPTLLEIFSVSYLEAMSAGLPILTSDFDFAREVCGPAALYFDPLSPSEIARSVESVMEDRGVRARLTTGSLAQLERWPRSWGDVARQYVNLCEELQADRREG